MIYDSTPEQEAYGPLLDEKIRYHIRKDGTAKKQRSYW